MRFLELVFIVTCCLTSQIINKFSNDLNHNHLLCLHYLSSLTFFYTRSSLFLQLKLLLCNLIGLINILSLSFLSLVFCGIFFMFFLIFEFFPLIVVYFCQHALVRSSCCCNRHFSASAEVWTTVFWHNSPALYWSSERVNPITRFSRNAISLTPPHCPTPFLKSSPTLRECQHLWGDVLETISVTCQR